MDALGAADWPKFLAFATLYALEAAAATAAAMPDSLNFGNSERTVGWDRTALLKHLEGRREYVASAYPETVPATPGTPGAAIALSAAWLTVGGGTSSEY